MKNLFLALFSLVALFTHSQQNVFSKCDQGILAFIVEDKGLEVLWGVSPEAIFWTNHNLLFLQAQEGVFVITSRYSDGVCIGEADKYLLKIEDCDSSAIYIPNSFTPNYDGDNEFFKVYGINIEYYKMMIYNRWGELIFQSEDINNFWSGENCQEGVYIYNLLYRFKDKSLEQRNGSINLIR